MSFCLVRTALYGGGIISEHSTAEDAEKAREAFIKAKLIKRGEKIVGRVCGIVSKQEYRALPHIVFCEFKRPERQLAKNYENKAEANRSEQRRMQRQRKTSFAITPDDVFL